MSIPVYEPLNTLKKVDTNIWIIDGERINMSVGPLKVPFSTRMTIIRLNDGSLWCHSPIKPTASLLSEVDQLGEVRHLISPNKIHYAFIGEWKKHYPQATAWSSPGVEKRARSQKISVSFDQALGEESPSIWQSEIKQLRFKGSLVVEEVVFFHKSSQTLILTDLIENFEPKRISFFWRIVHKFARTADPDGQTPIDFRMTFMGRKKQAHQCYQQMLAWQPEKIIIAHGRWYSTNGTAELQRAFRWLEKGKKKN